MQHWIEKRLSSLTNPLHSLRCAVTNKAVEKLEVGMKKILGLALLGIAIAVSIFMFQRIQKGSPRSERPNAQNSETKEEKQSKQPVTERSQVVESLRPYFGVVSAPLGTRTESYFEEIKLNWQPGSDTMLVESAQFCKNPRSLLAISDLVESKSEFKKMMGRNSDEFYHWLWSRDYTPHPDYARFKIELYGAIDENFARYFTDVDDAKIRLDEIRWGGVKQDGIPPLKNPAMISSGKASYLADTDVVFGISLNGDNRCYPKRILAWHEMFKDTIGGESVCGVY